MKKLASFALVVLLISALSVGAAAFPDGGMDLLRGVIDFNDIAPEDWGHNPSEQNVGGGVVNVTGERGALVMSGTGGWPSATVRFERMYFDLGGDGTFTIDIDITRGEVYNILLVATEYTAESFGWTIFPIYVGDDNNLNDGELGNYRVVHSLADIFGFNVGEIGIEGIWIQSGGADITINELIIEGPLYIDFLDLPAEDCEECEVYPCECEVDEPPVEDYCDACDAFPCECEAATVYCDDCDAYPCECEDAPPPVVDVPCEDCDEYDCECSSDTPWLIIGIAAGAVVAIGAVAFVVLAKKKKNT